jgi:hypothetical protein
VVVVVIVHEQVVVTAADRTGTDVMVFKYFRQKNWRKYSRFLLKLLLLCGKIWS